MLDFAVHGQEARRPDTGFRWSCMTGSLRDGTVWRIPEPLRAVHRAWATYQRNEVVNYALECVFRAPLAFSTSPPERRRNWRERW